MTFFEAALHILEKEGKPLSFKSITEHALGDKLLSHVGKDPEATMYYRLAAMAKRKGDRKIVATQPGTFGLLDWGVLEDPQALDTSPIPEPDDTEPALRPRERHPMPHSEGVRISGRGERHKHRDDRKKKQPVLAELAFEVLTQHGGPMSLVDLAAALRDTDKVPEDLGAEALLTALKQDNRRREGQNRRAFFALGEGGQVSLERAGSPGEGVPVDLQAALAQSLGMALDGRPPAKPGPGVQRVIQQVREHHRNMGRILRRRFGELEAGAMEIMGQALLEGQGLRDVRTVRKGNNLVLTGRRRDGLLDVRVAAQLIGGTREVTRTDVAELRRDLVNHGAHVGVVISAGEVAREARAEAQGGGALMLLWCGEALADKLQESKVGTQVITLTVTDIDDAVWRKAREQGATEDVRREERRREREQREQADRARREQAEREANEVSAVAAEVARSIVDDTAEAPRAESGNISEVGCERADDVTAEVPSVPVETIEVRVDLSKQASPTAEAIAQALEDHEPASPASEPEAAEAPAPKSDEPA